MWAVFGDLMAGLLGAFVLILVCVLAIQMELARRRLKAEVRQRQDEAQRREALEQALAVPLAAGRVTLSNGRIGISGSVLFAFNSAELQPEGRQLLKSLAHRWPPTWRRATRPDGQRLHRRPPGADGNRRFRRQLGAVGPARADGDAGADRGRHALAPVFAAAFGAEQPVASNADAAGARAEPARGDGADAAAEGGRQASSARRATKTMPKR